MFDELFPLFTNPPELNVWKNFISHVKAENWYSCWIWTASLTTYGYGRFHIGNRTVDAHRALVEWLYGVSEYNLVGDHIVCDNKQCVNPLHILLVHRSTNSRRTKGMCLAEAEISEYQCPHGHARTIENCYKPRKGRRFGECRLCKQIRYRQDKI